MKNSETSRQPPLPVPLARSQWAPGPARPVALEVLRHGPISRADIGAKLGLSHASLSRLCNPLVQQGILIEAGERTSGSAGRPTRLLDVDPASHCFLGLKVQATSMSSAVTNLRGDIMTTATTTLPEHSPAAVVRTIARLARSSGARRPLTGIGIGLGGAVRERRHVTRAGFLGWSDVPLAALVEAATGVPTLVENDVVALCEYEDWFGSAREDDRFAVITLGVGTGYGLVVNGQPITNADYGLGLVGHWPMLPAGPRCESGHRGCAAALLNADALAARVSAALGQHTSFDEALDLAAQRQSAAEPIVREAARGLGVLIAAICNLTLPQRVLIAGEGVRIAEIGWDDMLRGLHEHRDDRARTPPIELSQDLNREWARGAAALAIQAFTRGSLGGMRGL